MLLGACGRRGAIAPQKPATPVPEAKSEAKLGLHTTTATGEKKFIVVLVDFPDVKRQYPESFIRDRIQGFLPAYYEGASYGKLHAKIDVTGRYTLPNPVAYYRISGININVDPNKIVSLVTDMANVADKDVDFSQYSFVIISLGATQVEYGMVGLCAIPGMLGFQTGTAVTNNSGEKITGAVEFCENAHLGTYVHDTLHLLGGIVNNQRMTPCLYDHELQAEYYEYGSQENWSKCLVNMGYWDPLSSHFPYKKELPPTGLSSWTRLRLGWIDPSKIAMVNAGETAAFRLDPLEPADSATQVIKVRISDTLYYLIENRQPIELDQNLPTSGVLILFADDTVKECFPQGAAPVKIMDANPSIPALNDATFDIGKKQVYTDIKNNVAIILQKKVGQSYEIRITTPDKAK